MIVVDLFGCVIEMICVLVVGRVNIIVIDLMCEFGDMVVWIVWWLKDFKCKDGC